MQLAFICRNNEEFHVIFFPSFSMCFIPINTPFKISNILYVLGFIIVFIKIFITIAYVQVCSVHSNFYVLWFIQFNDLYLYEIT